ncbi:hypothetical protein RP20_CCG006335 [Aedes albopictus]|nr:hypothetical protein RP20_CCG006335 [Aedes albopictus]
MVVDRLQPNRDVTLYDSRWAAASQRKTPAADAVELHRLSGNVPEYFRICFGALRGHQQAGKTRPKTTGIMFAAAMFSFFLELLPDLWLSLRVLMQKLILPDPTFPVWFSLGVVGDVSVPEGGFRRTGRFQNGGDTDNCSAGPNNSKDKSWSSPGTFLFRKGVSAELGYSNKTGTPKVVPPDRLISARSEGPIWIYFNSTGVHRKVADN